MVRTVSLRPWQKAALERWAASPAPDFLAVATPGAGKTTFALTAARQDLGSVEGRRLVVVVPTVHLKQQWARAASAFDLHLDPQWTAGEGSVAPDMHGVVTTYQQVAATPAGFGGLAGNAMVIFDELHHAAEDRVWGEGLRRAFDAAPRRLALSGTPFRSDTHAIPFVRYTLDEAVPDYEYGYGDALADGGVVRPVYFPRIDGRMEWSAPDGSLQAHSFEDPLEAARAGQRLRTAYSVEGEWLPYVLRQAHEQLLAIRRRQPDAGGLVIATDQEHARGIVRLLRDRLRVRAVVATSDDPGASARITRFATGDDPWIVAVRMVAEGVDIPRLRVGVFATTTTTELFFRQAVGRLVRWTRGSSGQRSFLYIPDEPRLRARALAIAEQRRHSLRHDDREVGPATSDGEAGAEDQLSLFAPISAVPLGEVSEWELDADRLAEPADDETLTVELPPLPGRGRGLAGSAPAGRTRREEKEHLRKANADISRLLARQTGLSHAAVNAELNRWSGVTKVSEATIELLERRLRKAEQWRAQTAPRRASG
jgi:superfamily II DNA or RNA helicase